MSLFLLPHCDLHVTPDELVLNPSLPRLRVMFNDLGDNGMHIPLEVTKECTFEFFAPYEPVGARRDLLPKVDRDTGLVTVANRPGIYLFLVQHRTGYLVARLQVHEVTLDWWFGNSSITTAKDTVAHAQPSLYARYNTTGGTDEVGDITGHGYVKLKSLTQDVFTVDADGRLHGHREGTGMLEGTCNILGVDVTRTLPVRVLDYNRPRQTLEAVRISGLDDVSERCNLLFLSEGFRAQDRPRFDAIVTRMVDDLFNKPRHAPFHLVEDRFNVWKAFEPSEDHDVTCGFKVNDLESLDAELEPGFPIPFGNYDPALRKDLDKYSVEELTIRVGLPESSEQRHMDELVPLWRTQSLTDFQRRRVDEPTVEGWKYQTSRGILEARDTVFGFMLGSRPGDRDSAPGAPIPPPAGDDDLDPNLPPFIARLYEWFRTKPAHFLSPDPRRHPRERFDTVEHPNQRMSIMRYVAGLHWQFAPHPNIGQTWVPETSDTPFSPSRGLVVLLTQDTAFGAGSVCARLIATATLATRRHIPFQYVDDNLPSPLLMRRAPIPPQVQQPNPDVLDIVLRELAHNLNLGDEHEIFRDNDPEATAHRDAHEDNLTRLAAIFLRGTVDNGQVEFVTDEIDPLEVKWLTLPRIERSAMLIRDSETFEGQIKVTIDKRFIGWVTATSETDHPFAYLLERDFARRSGRQLPLVLDQHSPIHLPALIIGRINESEGTILLGGPSLPPAPFPVLPKGSLLYVPRFKSGGGVRHIVEPLVFDWMMTRHKSLNREGGIEQININEDLPAAIPGFVPPNYSYRVIGVYEGALYAGRRFRPAGACRMRGHRAAVGMGGEFCHVCKYLILHRIDPGMHAILDHRYYPTAKSE